MKNTLRFVLLTASFFFFFCLSLVDAAAHTNPTTTFTLKRPRLHVSLAKWWTARNRVMVDRESNSTTTTSTRQQQQGEEKSNNKTSTSTTSERQPKTEQQLDDNGMRLPLTPWQRRLFARPKQIFKQQQNQEEVEDVTTEEASHEMHHDMQQQRQEEPANDSESELSDTLQQLSDDAEEEEEPFEYYSTRVQKPLESQQDFTPLLALPSIGTIKSTLQSILKHPHLPKWGITGMQVGLVLYLLNGIWRAASEVMDEMQAELGRESSPHLLKIEQVRQIVKDLERQEDSSLDPTLQHLTRTLLKSGMPLFSQDETNSVERILLSLTRAEANILQLCLWTPSKEPTSFDDIAGLHPIKQSLLDLVWTIKSPNNNPYAHVLQEPPGVLLYGPPGCGKTMLVKALSSATQLPCLVVTPSVLLRKYVGDTNLQVRALFSLARKLSPCIVCLDELDGIFRERSSTEHDVSRDLKTEFLQWWDGIASSGTILMVGATNRPFEVDSAVLRRMPHSYFVGLPNYQARRHFLAYLLKNIPTSDNVELDPLASQTEGYTPSDLRHVVRMAVTMGPLRDARYTRDYRPLSSEDVTKARAAVAPTPLTPGYRAALIEYAQRNSGQVMTTTSSSSGSTNNPWDSFFDAGTIHADQAIEWSEQDEVDDEYYEDHGTDSEGLE